MRHDAQLVLIKVSNIVLVARIIVAAIFAVAGVAKLLDTHGTRAALEGFGVAPRFVPTGTVALPAAELATAVLVLVPATAWWGGLGALLLLAIFMVAVAVNLGRGRTPDCHCFGQLATSTIGRGTIVRNACFAVPALIVVLFG